MNAFRCDYCGVFVSYADLDSGRASHNMITPDSQYTSEEWETECAKCKDKVKEKKGHAHP